MFWNNPVGHGADFEKNDPQMKNNGGSDIFLPKLAQKLLQPRTIEAGVVFFGVGANDWFFRFLGGSAAENDDVVI